MNKLRPLGMTLMAWAMVAWACGFAEAAPKAEHVRQGKKATALVEAAGRGFGSAFCIDAAGYFITNEHVVRGFAGDKTVTLVLDPSDERQRILTARVVRVDAEKDLALLRVTDARDLAALKLGDTKNLIETAELVAFGYPFGTALAVKNKEYPSISVNVGRVTALRKSDGALTAIQTDAAVNPGNSGGPVIDDSGDVVGVIAAGVRGGGALNFAIPADQVARFLAQPQISLDVPPIDFADREKEIELVARVTTFVKDKPRFDVELTLDGGAAGRRVVKGKPKGDGYVLRLRPLEPVKSAAALPVELAFAAGSVRGLMEDIELAIADKGVRLSQISRLERDGDKWQAVFKDGAQVKAVSIQLGKLSVELGGAMAQLESQALRSLVVYEPKAPPSELPFTVVATKDGRPAGQLAGVLRIGPAPKRPPAAVAGAAAAGAAPLPGYEPPAGATAFEGDRVQVKLSEPYTSFTIAGGGRYYAFHLKSAKAVAILDVLAGKVVHTIPGIPEDAILAGGRDNLVLAFPGQKLMQRWSLDPFEREKTAPLPGKGATYRVLLGANSRGPMLVCAEDAQFVDLATMQPISVEGKTIGGADRYGYRIDASADGRVFTGIPTGYGPVGYARMRTQDRKTLLDGFGSTSHRIRWAWPTADASLFLLPGAEIYSSHLKKLECKSLEGCTLYPTVDPRYFIAVRFVADAKEKHVTHVNICTVADRRIVHTFVGFEEMAPSGNTNSRNSTAYRLHEGEERFHYVPWAHALVTFAWSGDVITIARFNLIESLEHAGVDYLFVTSTPRTEAARGQTYQHALAVTSKAGGLKFTLESGPRDMVLSPAGELRWDVPAQFADATAAVIVRIADRSGAELFHSFEIALQDSPAPPAKVTEAP